MVDTLSMKLWWLFRSQRSLLPYFLLDKYFIGIGFSFVKVSHSASFIWKRLKFVGLQTETHIVWYLGVGHIFF